MGEACLQWVRLVVNGCNMSSVCMIVPQSGWYVPNGYAYVLSWCIYGLSRYDNASVGVKWLQYVWQGLSGCCMVSVVLAWLQSVWHGHGHVFSVGGMSSMGVACSL